MMIQCKCPQCGATMEVDDSREFIFCLYCGTKIYNATEKIEVTQNVNVSGTVKHVADRTGEPTLKINYTSTDSGVTMVVRMADESQKAVLVSGQTITKRLKPGSHRVIMKIGKKNYARDIVVPESYAPVLINASWSGRANIAVDQPPIEFTDVTDASAYEAAPRKRGKGWLVPVIIVGAILILGIIGLLVRSFSPSTNNPSNAPDDKPGTNATTAPTEEPAPKDPLLYELAGVRVLPNIQTAVDIYTVDVEEGQEVLYALVEVYNNSNKLRKGIGSSNLSLYVDGTKAAETDTGYLDAVDGYKEALTCNIDPGTSALVVNAFVVEKGWKEAKVFYGDESWTVKPEDTLTEPFVFASKMIKEKGGKADAPGTELYSEDYNLTYDGARFYTKENSLMGDSDYVVFEFTITNPKEESVDYKLVGYSMRGYRDNLLLDGATYTMTDVIDGYENIYGVDEIKAGMSAKVYVAFEVKNKTGAFRCEYDVGYIMEETLGSVTYIAE